MQPQVSVPNATASHDAFKGKLKDTVCSAIKEQLEVFLPNAIKEISATCVSVPLQEMQIKVDKDISSLAARIDGLQSMFTGAASPSSGAPSPGRVSCAQGQDRPLKPQGKCKPSKAADSELSSSASRPPLPPAGLGKSSESFDSDCSKLWTPGGFYLNDFVVLHGIMASARMSSMT